MKSFLVTGVFLAFLSVIPAYLTHLFWMIGTLFGDDAVTTKDAAIMVIGTFLPPIGAIHGYTIWF